MKLLLIPLLLAGAGAGWYGLSDSPAASDVPAACDPSGCRVTVEPTPRGTCIVTCYEEDGSIRCQEEIECSASCDRPCDAPCESASSCSR
jgi:hypothetical protein